MTALADMHSALARETCELLHNVLRLSVRATTTALKLNRDLTEPEQRTLIEGFRAAAMALDVTKHAAQRERFGLSQYFPPQLVSNLIQAGRVLAQNTALLEKRRDRFVLEFQLRLRQRLEKQLQPRDREAAPQAEAKPDDGEPRFAFTTQPSPDQGYTALTMLDGRYDEIKEALREAAAEEAAEIRALKAEEKAAAEAIEPPEPAPQSPYNQYYTPEKAARMSAEFLAAKTRYERYEVVKRQAQEMFRDYLLNPPKRDTTGPPE